MTFGNAGVWNPAPECCGPSRANALALQADDKLVLAGYSSNGFARQVAVVRINANGTLDAAFGAGGVAEFALAEVSSEARDVVVKPDGSIVVAGNFLDGAGASQPFVLKLSSTGQRDVAFGTNGVVRLSGLSPNSPEAIARAVRVQPDGKVLVAGRLTRASGDFDMFVTRLVSNGSIDGAFGPGGTVSSGFSGNDEAYAMELGSDGTILLAGQARVSGTDYPGVIRLLGDGSFDASLNGTGRLLPVFNFPGTLRSAALQPDGRILLAGRVNSQPTTVRLLASGALDLSYNTSGAQQLSNGVIATGIGVMGDGRHLVFLEGPPSDGGYSTRVERLLPDGSVDGSWNSPMVGIFVSGNGDGRGGSLLLGPAGESWIATGMPQGYGDTVVYKLDPTGAYSATFGTLGVLTASIGLGAPRGEFQSVASDAVGRVYTIRDRFCEPNVTPPACGVVTRFTAKGQPDATFGTNGRVLLTVPGEHHVDDSVVLRDDGKIFHSTKNQLSNTTHTARRLNADGGVDSSFSAPALDSSTSSLGLEALVVPYPGADLRFLYATNGFIGRYLDDGTFDPAFHLGTPIQVTPVYFNHLSLHSGGLVVAGRGIVIHGPPPNGRVWRFLSDGAPDMAFGTDGSVEMAIGQFTESQKLAVQGDGKILVGGNARRTDTFNSFAYVARLTPSGALDPAFGSGGVFMGSEAEASIRVTGLSVQPDGKIVVAGSFQFTGAFRAAFVTRLTSAGTLDSTFGEGGTSYFSVSPGDDTVGAMTLQPDGGIVLAGMSDASPNVTGRYAVMKLLAQPYGLQVTPSRLSVGGVTVPYQYGLSASGGTAPYTFTIANGNLPPGLSLSGDTITGTPTSAGEYEFVVQASDGGGAIGAQAYVLTIHSDASLISSYYETVMGRGADAAGLAFWQGEVQRMVSQGVGVAEAFYVLAGVFFNSPEYLQRNASNTQFLTDLYRTFFSREPDSAGLNFWASQLSSGKPRAAVMNDFLFSPEFAGYMSGVFGSITSSRAEVSMVLDFYRGFLGRLPDDAGLDFWVGMFRTAQCNAGVQGQADFISSRFLNGAEYSQRDAARPAGQRTQGYVVDLYSAFMRRGVDLAGFQFYVNQIDSGSMTRDQARLQFVASPEFQNRVSAVMAQGCMP